MPDDSSTLQAQRVRDSRCMPEWVYNPALGEANAEVFSVKGNPSRYNDWHTTKNSLGEKYTYTLLHWAATEARFRRHIVKAQPEELETMIRLEEILLRLTQHDVTQRLFHNKDHRAFIPEFGVYTNIDLGGGKIVPFKVSRQAVLFCVERRKSWRMQQSRANVVNKDYNAQKMLLDLYDNGKLDKKMFMSSQITILFDECHRAIKEGNEFDINNCLEGSALEK